MPLFLLVDALSLIHPTCYETPLPVLTDNVANLSAKVEAHLQKMGFY